MRRSCEEHTQGENPVYDPTVRVTGDGKQITVIISIPDVNEEDIRIDLEKTMLTVSFPLDGKRVRKAIRVPQGMHLLRKQFSTRVLKIMLENATGMQGG